MAMVNSAFFIVAIVALICLSVVALIITHTGGVDGH
jgi:hypothetical protein